MRVVFACVPFPHASRTHAPTAPCLPFLPIHPALSAMPSSTASSPPSLLIIGTGGTIAGVAASAGSTAGYQAGALPIGQILDSVPGLSTLVPEGRLATEQVFSIPSEQMSGAHWLQLAGRLRAWLNGDKAPDAIVITHGTDTLEETAFFLSLVLPPTRPVLLTGAMRPASALSADGPGNLYDACRFALAARQAGIGGVFVSFGGRVLRADAVYKQHANRTDAFAQRFGQPVAWLEADRPCWQPALAASGLQGLFATLALAYTAAVPALPEGDASSMTLPPVSIVPQGGLAAVTGLSGAGAGRYGHRYHAGAHAGGAGPGAPRGLSGGARQSGTGRLRGAQYGSQA